MPRGALFFRYFGALQAALATPELGISADDWGVEGRATDARGGERVFGLQPSAWRAVVASEDRRGRLWSFIFVALPVLSGYVLMAATIGARWGLVLNCSALAAVLFSAVLLKWTRRDRLAAVIYLVACFALIFGSGMLSGGMSSATLWLLPLITMSCAILLGTRACLATLACSIVFLLVATYVDIHAPIEREYPTRPGSTAVLRCVEFLFVALIARITHEASVKQLARRKEIGEALARARENSAKADARKSQFLGQISHELRTPMNALLGSTQYLRVCGDLSPEMDAKVGAIQRGAESVLERLNEALYISCSGNARADRAGAPLELVRLIEDQVTRFRASRAFDAKSIHCFGERDEVWIEGERDRIAQVVANILGVALSASKGARIDVALTARPEHGPLPSDFLQVEVLLRQEGEGMTDQQVQALWQDEYISRCSIDGEESPLGLAIAREIAEPMGGSLTVDSAMGQGSNFRFRFKAKASVRPKARAFSLSDIAEPSASVGLQAAKVLVVDDLAINRKVVALALSKLGCEVIQAVDGQDAVDQAAQERFDLIFMDLNMPNKDGIEATLEILRGHGPNQKSPIVALTASAGESVRERCFQAGMSDYLSKPFRLVDLRRCLESHVGAKALAVQEEQHAA